MISIFLASILCSGAPLGTENAQTEIISTVQTASNSFQMGLVVVDKIRADYKDGKYNQFLKEMDSDYRDAKRSNDLEGLIELRKENAKVNIHPEFIRSFYLIQDAKNKNLVAAVGSDQSPFAQKIRSAAASVPEESRLLNSFHYKLPEAGDENNDENAVIGIDLEYTYKAIHLDALAASGDSIPDKREKQMVLEMEKMDRLVKASQDFQDKELKQAIEKSASTLDQRLAKKYDMKDLQDLSNGRIKAISPLEEKAAAIVGNAQGQISELHRHLLNHLDSEDPIAETVQN